jgi:KUP system potassium uptake protein
MPVERIPGTAVYLTALDGGTPLPLNRNIEHHHVLHEHVVLFTSAVKNVPTVADANRLEVSELGQGIIRMVVAYGFQEQPDVPAALRLAAAGGVNIDPGRASYFLGHVTLNPVDSEGMALWRKRLFASMSRNSFRASTYLGIPSDRVVEVGTQVDI